MEEKRVLEDHAHLAPKRLECEVADILAVQPNRAQLRVVEAREQARDRGLAGAGRPNQRGKLTGLDRERHVLDRRPVAGAVAERHLIELNLSVRLLEIERLRFLADGNRKVHVLEDALEARE